MVVAALNPIFTMTLGLSPALAQSARYAHVQNDVWFYLILLVAAAIVVTIIGLIARKILTGPIEAAEGETVFDLSELRRLHREGRLTDAEYQAARAATLKQGANLLTDHVPDPQAPASPPSPDTVGRPGVELGPELLDRPKPPGSDRGESDKPGQASDSPDNPPAG